MLLLPVLAALLTVATYALARRAVTPRWALLAALTVACLPVVSDYSREFVFAIPAALFLTLSIWALLRSDHLQRPGWIWLAGLFVGCLVLSRTMTVSFLPGIAVVALGQLFASAERRRERVTRLLVGAGIATFVAASWFLHNWRSVYDYLTSSGYGSSSGAYGQSDSVASWHYWSKELGLILNELYLPLGIALAGCFMVAAGFAVARRPVRVPDARAILGSAVFALAVTAVEGYLALTSSSNEGTAFALPFIPALVILAVIAVSRVSARPVRPVLASVLIAISVGNLLMKGGSVSTLAVVRTASVPSLGKITVTDGRGLIQVNYTPPRTVG